MSPPSSNPVPPSRIAPSISSPSILASEPRAPQPSKRLPRPFLLRSTTPLSKAPEEPKKSSAAAGEEDGQERGKDKLTRSKTETALTKPATTRSTISTAKPLNPPLATNTSRRSSRTPTVAPLTSTSTSMSSTSVKTLPIRASRKIVFVPDPTPPAPSSSSSTSRTTNTALRPSRGGVSSSRDKVEAVEKRKMELKRESLLSRRNGGGGSNENNPPGGTPASPRRWSLRPVRDSLPRRTTLNSTQLPPDSPSPSPPLRRPDEIVAVDSPSTRRASLRGPAVRESTIVRSNSTNQLRKKASYAELSRAPTLAVNMESEEDEQEGVTSVGRMQRSKEVGYTSLQDILTEQGYQDTRVLTPMSKAKAKGKETITVSSSSLAPPCPPQVKEKTSMLSLRGLFSLWGPSSAETDQGGNEDENGSEQGGREEQDPSSPNGSGGTFTHSPISRAREWVQGVAIATAQDLDRSPALVSTSDSTPPFQYSLSTTEDSPSSCRSYSSSIVTASSVRSPPPQVTIAHSSSPTVALSPPQSQLSLFNRFPPTTSSTTLSPPPRSSTAIKTLRHVVSDSTLPQYLPHYTSFPFSPSSASSSVSTSPPQPSPMIDSLLSPFSNSNQPSPSSPSNSPSSWIPSTSSLRHRASQVFSLPMVGLGLTSSTPLFAPLQSGIARTIVRAEKGRVDGGGGGDKRAPKLLRKAVSSAGLVRPVLTTTNY
ncbi:uncharacterized protein JCM6883_006045 [Sporobolomyces salmoneus]|uniref:uncharacterized protein n=1 Tax=Sporobolomyces salmoneus TaxID=183962 RepID=UPI0031767E46